jgi:hypothetical protein|nr:hypothetical protein [Actinophrys sol]
MIYKYKSVSSFSRGGLGVSKILSFLKRNIHLDSILKEKFSSILDEYLYLSKFRFQYYKNFIENLKNNNLIKTFIRKDYINDCFINHLPFEENLNLINNFLLKVALKFDDSIDDFKESLRMDTPIKPPIKVLYNYVFEKINPYESIKINSYETLPILEEFCSNNNKVLEHLNKVKTFKLKNNKNFRYFIKKPLVFTKEVTNYPLVISENILNFVNKESEHMAVQRYFNFELELDDFNLYYISYFLKNKNYIKSVDFWLDFCFNEDINSYLDKYKLIFLNKLINKFLKKKYFKNLFVLIDIILKEKFLYTHYIISPKLKSLVVENLFYVNIKYFNNVCFKSKYNINLIFNNFVFNFNINNHLAIKRKNIFLYKVILTLEYFYLFNMHLIFNNFAESTLKNQNINFFLLEYVVLNFLFLFENNIKDIYNFMLNLILNKNTYIKYLNKYFPFFYLKFKEILFLVRNKNFFSFFKQMFYNIQNINFYNTLYNNSFNLLVVRLKNFNFKRSFKLYSSKCFHYFSYFPEIFSTFMDKSLGFSFKIIDSPDIKGLSQKRTVLCIERIVRDRKFVKLHMNKIKDFEKKWSISFFMLHNNIDLLYANTKDLPNKKLLMKEFFSLDYDKVARRKMKEAYQKQELAYFRAMNIFPRGRGRPKKNVSNT